MEIMHKLLMLRFNEGFLTIHLAPMDPMEARHVHFLPSEVLLMKLNQEITYISGKEDTPIFSIKEILTLIVPRVDQLMLLFLKKRKKLFLKDIRAKR